MRKLFPLCALLLSLISNPAFCSEPVYISVEQLLADGKLSVQIEGAGGYQQECVTMVVKNQSSTTLHGLVEPGRRLNSVDDGEQDILVVKSKQFSLAPGQTDTLQITGFCCESTTHAPQKKSGFTIGLLAPAAWLILTQVIDRFNFPPAAIQNAIWVLSNNHDIRSIPAFNNPETDKLRHTVAEILDIELPWYSFAYAHDENDLFSGKKTHLFAEVPFTIPFQALISTQITDAEGNTVYDKHAGSFKAGDNTLRINVPIGDWAVTDYYLYITEDFHTTNKRLKLTLKDIQPVTED